MLKRLFSLEALEYEYFTPASEEDKRKIQEALDAEHEVNYNPDSGRVYVNGDHYLADVKDCAQSWAF